ncbi:MAG: RNA 2',3'-cyclic phosphodiesterase [Acidobacteria bacterium]|nr:RNA 2',3'-cyclic phosphodiesterase [Acidobacteriota bacterium]MBV9624482.1 RNA 2',3'-cyclic phosphodiesterase [Acidobacteriota bacterium]
MRLFVAIDLDDAIRDEIRRFIDIARAFAPEVRWVQAESLHVTLKFIGEQPDAKVHEVQKALSSISLNSFQLLFRGCGFFPTPRAARVFWVGIEADRGLGELQTAVEQALEKISIPRERRAYSPHLTLAREGSGAPRWRKGDHLNQRFTGLQGYLAANTVPEFGSMPAREFFLYRSQLSRQGSRYTKIGRFALHSAKN